MNRLIILGAGPAGLTAGYEGLKRGLDPVIYEQDLQVGGISKTVNYQGYRFDMGGHRFFTKSKEVQRGGRKSSGTRFSGVRGCRESITTRPSSTTPSNPSTP